MITTTLNALQQTCRLGGSTATGVYEDGELDGLLTETLYENPCEAGGAQLLSPEMLSQILSGEFTVSHAGKAERH